VQAWHFVVRAGTVVRRTKGLVFSFSDSVVFGGPPATDAPAASDGAAAGAAADPQIR